MRRAILSSIISAGLVATAPVAFAQYAGQTGTEQRHAEQREHAPRPSRLPGERIEARLAYLKTALKITEAQQSQWQAFADTLRKQARAMDERVQARRAQHASPQPTTAIERLERRQARLAAAAARLGEMLAAAKPLYTALSPEQQKIADELLSRRHGGHRHARRHGRA